jgi:hypothetical protein
VKHRPDAEFLSILYRQTYGRFLAHRTPADHEPPEELVTEKPCLSAIPLPHDLPSWIGDLDETGPEAHQWPWTVRLATLLHGTLGIHRWEIGTPRPLHRPVPSPRCLYASELIVCLGPDAPIPDAGVCRYHPVLHRLEVRCRNRDWRVLEQALGFSLEKAEAVLAICADWWRIAWIYGDFAFHLATLEAGHVRGQILLLAGLLGWHTTWHDSFDGDALSAWAGLDPGAESPLSVVILWKEETEPELAQATGDPRLARMRHRSPWATKVRQCPDLVRLMEWTQPTLALPAESAGPSRRNEEISERIPLDPAGGHWKRADWLEILRRRSGGNDLIGMMTEWSPLSFGDLSLVLDTFWELAGQHPGLFRGIRLYLWVQRVAGLKPGVYRLEPDRTLVPHRLNPDCDLQDVSTAPNRAANLRSVPAAVFLTADYVPEYRATGPRAYPVLQMRAGHLAQLLALLASAMDWMLRPVKSFNEFRAEEELCCLSPSETAVYLLLIGKNRHPFLFLDMSL